jgi:hypothetical protein
MKLRHCFRTWPIAPSRLAGAAQVPSLSTTGLFFTGPRPPLSPWISSDGVLHVVAVQVAFGKHTSKPGFHLIGSMVETRRF